MKSNTFNILIQLYIEQILSGAKSYIASHPELGVPLGVFNYKHEPNYEARVKSIKKLGFKGNQLSLHLAEILGIKNPIPSFLLFDEEDDPFPPPPPECPPNHITIIFENIFGLNVICIPVDDVFDDDGDVNVFALDRISGATTIGAVEGFDSGLNAVEAENLDEVLPAQIGISQGISVGLTNDVEYQGNAYNYIPSLLRNWQSNAYKFADELGVINIPGAYFAQNYDANAIQANGNISFKTWLEGTVVNPGGGANQHKKEITMLGNNFYTPPAPHRMAELINNAATDSTINTYVAEDDDGDVLTETVGVFGG